MGVDIPNVRTVIHLGPYADMDDYFQESGLAGRDVMS
jgi:superfamily II DNA helicase RecQ